MIRDIAKWLNEPLTTLTAAEIQERLDYLRQELPRNLSDDRAKQRIIQSRIDELEWYLRQHPDGEPANAEELVAQLRNSGVLSNNDRDALQASGAIRRLQLRDSQLSAALTSKLQDSKTGDILLMLIDAFQAAGNGVAGDAPQRSASLQTVAHVLSACRSQLLPDDR